MKYNLSEITDLIRSRRSIPPEQFSAREVHREQVELILTNAIWAPTHGLTQPWRFRVFMEDGRTQLAQMLPELYRRHTPPEKFRQSKYDRLRTRALHVSVIIAVCMERDPEGRIPELEEAEAVACAVQNMLLTCAAYGLGAFWSTPGFVYTEDMQKFLGLSAGGKCLGLVYIGYPSGEWPMAHRRPLEYVAEWIMKEKE